MDFPITGMLRSPVVEGGWTAVLCELAVVENFHCSTGCFPFSSWTNWPLAVPRSDRCQRKADRHSLNLGR